MRTAFNLVDLATVTQHRPEMVMVIQWETADTTTKHFHTPLIGSRSSSEAQTPFHMCSIVVISIISLVSTPTFASLLVGLQLLLPLSLEPVVVLVHVVLLVLDVVRDAVLVKRVATRRNRTLADVDDVLVLKGE